MNRTIADDRIKRIAVVKKFPNGVDDERIKREFASEMAAEITAKLLEFNKFSTYRSDEGITYFCSVEVVIPPTGEYQFKDGNWQRAAA